MSPKLLVVLTSQKTLGNTEKPTGWFLPEFAHPYHVLSPHVSITVASPAGGEAPLDPGSVEMFAEDDSSQSFMREHSALWQNTQRLDQVSAADFDAIFFVGGHGPMYDVARSPTVAVLLKQFVESGKLIAAVCHGSGALLDVRLPDGSNLVQGEPVTGFSNSEEESIGLLSAMPFELETELLKNGGKYEKADQLWGEKVCIGRGGKLITGQNPASGTGVGEAIKAALGV